MKDSNYVNIRTKKKRPNLKHFPKFIWTFIISIITFFFIANNIEPDLNAVGMYIVIFFFPSILVGFLNGMSLLFASEISTCKLYNFGLIVLPFITSLAMTIFGEGLFEFVGIFAAIATGIVNSYYSWRILS